jgi:putative hydroxymethylpyrimidine transporter CytX
VEKNKTSAFSNGLIWFGAAVSIAEILTGTYFAPLGLGMGLLAIVIGHLIGGILFYFTGLIGTKTEKSAMETAKISFGQKGSVLFSGLNILQLIGWTAVMIISGAEGANSIVKLGIPFWSIIIGALIILWVAIGIKRMNQINIVAVGALFILTIILSSIIFRNNSIAIVSEGMSFGTAVELSVAMPLSWLPLISDYTRTAKKPRLSTLVSAITYFFASCWMYTIGMGAAIFTGESDIAKIMMNAGLGIAALIIVVFATVTTTFLDAYSAGVSSESISKKLKEKPAAIVVCIIGVVLAIFTPITQFENFLYLIGSVFAPMAAILITDYFIVKSDYSKKGFCWTNLILWAVGFAVYRIRSMLRRVGRSTIQKWSQSSQKSCLSISKAL